MKRQYITPLYGIRCHYGAWWLGRRFEAITWFGRIYFNCNEQKLKEKLLSPEMVRTERHERIHLMQVKTFRTRYFGFYIYYIYFWLKAILRYRNRMKAYYATPFEREAYCCENIENYQESKWREYINETNG